MPSVGPPERKLSGTRGHAPDPKRYGVCETQQGWRVQNGPAPASSMNGVDPKRK